jgi:hypothetical protein
MLRAELRTMLRHLNRPDLNGTTWALLTVYNLQGIIRFSLTLMLSSVKAMASSRFGNEDPDAFRNDNLRNKKTDDSTKFALSVLRVHECSGQTGCRYFIVIS